MKIWLKTPKICKLQSWTDRHWGILLLISKSIYLTIYFSIFSYQYQESILRMYRWLHICIIYLTVCLSVSLFFSVWLSVFVCLSIWGSVLINHSFIHLSTYLYVCLSINLSVYLFLHLSIYLLIYLLTRICYA